MQDMKVGTNSELKVSLSHRAIMLVLTLIGAIIILRPIVAFQNLSRGNFYIDNGYVKNAITHYQKAVLLDPNSSDAYRNLGFAYKQDKQVDKAIQAYKKGLKINPRDHQLYFELGRIYFGRRDFKKAVSNFEKAHDADPCDLNARNMQAISYREMGEREKAISIWQSILKKKPDYEPAKINLEKLK